MVQPKRIVGRLIVELEPAPVDTLAAPQACFWYLSGRCCSSPLDPGLMLQSAFCSSSTRRSYRPLARHAPFTTPGARRRHKPRPAWSDDPERAGRPVGRRDLRMGRAICAHRSPPFCDRSLLAEAGESSVDRHDAPRCAAGQGCATARKSSTHGHRLPRADPVAPALRDLPDHHRALGAVAVGVEASP